MQDGNFLLHIREGNYLIYYMGNIPSVIYHYEHLRNKNRRYTDACVNTDELKPGVYPLVNSGV
jgi:hypothetical protein